MKTHESPALDLIAASYERDGYTTLSELLTAEECEILKAEALRVLDKNNSRVHPSVFVGVAAASSVYYRLASDPRIVSVLRLIMPDGVMFMSDKFVFKSAEQKNPTPWHIDQFYWPNTRPKLSVWIPLDDSTAENGTLKVVPGTHKQSWRSRGNESGNEFIHVIRDQPWRPEEEVTCELNRGGAIFFSDRLVHGSCPNTAGVDRYAIISTYHAPAVDEPFDLQFPARHTIVPKPLSDGTSMAMEPDSTDY